MNWWEIYISLGIATAIVYLFRYYYPAIDIVKDTLKEQDINVKEISIFNPWRLGFMSVLYIVIYSVLFPIMLLGILFASKILKKSTENMILKEVNG